MKVFYGLLVGFFLLIPARDFFSWVGLKCPIKHWTGLSCPTCGLGRGMLSLWDGNWAAAWDIQPLAPIFFIAVTGFATFWVVKTLSKRTTLGQPRL